MAEQPENLVLEHLRGLRRDIGDIKSDVQTLKTEMATKSDLHSLRADVASDAEVARMQKDTRDQIVGLRRAATGPGRRPGQSSMTGGEPGRGRLGGPAATRLRKFSP